MASGKQALLLGAGFVCEPTVQALSAAGVHVTVACRTLSAAQALASKHPNTTAVALDASSPEALSRAIAAHDIIISLLPYTLHPLVVEAAITHRKPVVTTSYISPALHALHARAQDADITILNEIGLDPGIDHLYAVKTIDEVHRAGGHISSFTSYCGALPAPDAADNPLGYKFSWSPRGGLLALRNPGKWYQDGVVASVAGEDLMAAAQPHRIDDLALVGYPNRDSVGFRDFYRIPEARTVFRGTLRYPGFPAIIRALAAIGYFSQEARAALAPGAVPGEVSWAALTAEMLGVSSAGLVAAVEEKVAAVVAGEEERRRVVDGLRWIGLFEEETPVQGRATPLDTLCGVLERKMAYAPGERDMIVLQHVFDIEHADGSREKRSSTLVEYGEPLAPGSRSAMAKLVGLPCAVGVLAVLEGRITEKGMVAPWTSSEIAALLREELKEKFSIELTEKSWPA
ncbi:saccharopine dehydrogenase [Aspergillus clavatus NRRL 1]|uniref:Saccharopine dehydrogenase n=1 Tax=Aspergillus clavatus (strain ATCC 1007 / CBS 513.65 / DSM 816 / NCTC 3887 / NRRL 1 / QM 1276 / 107) TaxID=344612 RepID=A1C5F9_ASPCL|nr:saccharopine dehydrogenase [Aspergillus clavatus NRRL 1]EAW14927.1 saccharopine dehydrogenase [Aspergillus clavatus NRRL 1]